MGCEVEEMAHTCKVVPEQHQGHTKELGPWWQQWTSLSAKGGEGEHSVEAPQISQVLEVP